jgi:hypothetical protein
MQHKSLTRVKTLSYSEARESLATLIEEVVSTREEVIIERPSFEPVAVIPADGDAISALCLKEYSYFQTGIRGNVHQSFSLMGIVNRSPGQTRDGAGQDEHV